MIYVIHKTLVLIKIHLNYLKDNIFECFLKSIIDLKKKKKGKQNLIAKNDGKS